MAPTGVAPSQVIAESLICEEEGDLHLHPVLGDLSRFVDQNLLVLDPCALQTIQRLVGADKSRPDGVVEALC